MICFRVSIIFNCFIILSGERHPYLGDYCVPACDNMGPLAWARTPEFSPSEQCFRPLTVGVPFLQVQVCRAPPVIKSTYTDYTQLG